jgi:polysaccharide export outer membrane protein
MKIRALFIFITSIIILSSCNSYKEIGYLQGIDTINQKQLSEAGARVSIKLVPGDMLTIFVNTVDPSASVPFNLPLVPILNNGLNGIQSTVGTQAYLINNDGNIEMPVLGILHVAGKDRQEVADTIKSLIYPKYTTKEPIVTVRHLGYKISVLGEVNRPGPLNFSSERVNILEALAAAGDLTIYGRRDNILLMRENEDGSSQFIRINLQDKNLALSPYFYIKQNDVLYIEPNKARGNSAAIGSNENFTMGIVSTIVGSLLTAASIIVSIIAFKNK